MASNKASEAGFDLARGGVALSESFINLSSARSVLQDAIEKQKLVRLPITVQREVLSNLQAISKSLVALTNGTDEIVNLTNAIEALNTSVWKYGLHNLSAEVLGYQRKLNQLKNQEVQISKMVSALEAAKNAAEQARAATSETEKKRTEAGTFLEQITQASSVAATLLEQTRDASAKSSALFATIQQNEKQSGELLAGIKTASNELLSFDKSIRDFYAQVDEYRKKIAQASDDASKLITTTETTIKGVVETASAKVNDLVDGSQTKVKGAIDELTTTVTDSLSAFQATTSAALGDLNAKFETKLKSDGQSFAEFTSATKSDLTTFQSGVETNLKNALGDFNKSSSNLIDATTSKVKDLEQGLHTRSEETIEVNRRRTEELLEELAMLKEQVRVQIQQATGFALFGAFQARQNQIVGSKQFWAWAIGVLVLLSVAVTSWIAYAARFYSAHDFAFWIKLSLTIPIGYAIAFRKVQYSRERRLEEEYAFKASISVSLNPYRELVYSILEKDGVMDQAKYAEFVIESVKGVFASPTDKVFEGEKKEGVTYNALKKATELAAIAAKTAK